MWPFTKRQVDPGAIATGEAALDVLRQEIRTLKRRVEDLEDDQEAIARRFERLRGQVTGALRYNNEPEDDDDEYEDERPGLV